MRHVDYTDSRGFKTLREVPDDVGGSNEAVAAQRGISIGPPEFDTLDDIPQEVRVRLNNELHARGIITLKDAMRRRGEVMSALQSALKLDVEMILKAYQEG